MGIIEELASLRASVESLTRAVGRHSRVPEQRWATVTTCTASEIRVTFPGTSGDAIITRSTEAVWVGAQVLVQVQGNDRWIVGLGGGSVPAGSSVMFSGPVVPAGWLFEDGQAYSRATYWRLFNALGGNSSPHGLGDGSTTFNVPNSTGRVWVGIGTATGAAGATAHTLGQKAGEETHVLTTSEMPSHRHRVGLSNDPTSEPAVWAGQEIGSTPYSGWGFNIGGTSGYLRPFVAAATGGDVAHNNMPPYAGKVPIIKF